MSAHDIDTDYLLQIRDQYADRYPSPRLIRELAGKLAQVICELRELHEEQRVMAILPAKKVDRRTLHELPQARLVEPAAKAGTTFALDVVLLPENGGRLFVQVLRLPEPDSMPRVITELVLTAESTVELLRLLARSVDRVWPADGSPEG